MQERQNIKYLITSGCSFSQVPNSDITWPVSLGKSLNVETEYNGRGACGNGIISRSIIHRVSLALKNYKPGELLVGIMWSSIDRLEVYKTNIDLEITKIVSGNPYYSNPQWIAGDSHYCILSPHYNDEFTKTYHKYFYSKEWASILSYEHILRVEWFLKSRNIKYFMTGYSKDVFPPNNLLKNPDINYLHNLIDWDNWLDVRDMDSWARNTGLAYRKRDDPHPSTEMHELFVNTVILPHLKKKGYINGNT